MKVFDAITRIDLPEAVEADSETRRNPAFEIEIVANGEIPFPQVILHAQDGQRIIGAEAIERAFLPQDEEFGIEIPEQSFAFGGILEMPTESWEELWQPEAASSDGIP